MSTATKSGGGSFHELRDRHLFLFEGERMVHFHQRGDEAPTRHTSGRQGKGGARPRWRTNGIFHYKAEDAEEAESAVHWP